MRPVFEKAILLAETISEDMRTDGAIKQVGTLMHLGMVAQRDLNVNSPAPEEVKEFAEQLARVWGRQNLTRRKLFRGLVLSLCTVIESPQVDAFLSLFDDACDSIESKELKSVGQEVLAAQVSTNESGKENETPDDVRRAEAIQSREERRQKLEEDIRAARQTLIALSAELDTLNAQEV